MKKQIFLTFQRVFLLLCLLTCIHFEGICGTTDTLDIKVRTIQVADTPLTISCISSAKNEIPCSDSVEYAQLFYFKVPVWQSALDIPANLVLYINDIPLPYYSCVGVNKKSGKIFFSVELRSDITNTSQKTIIELLRKDLGISKNTTPLHFAIGTRNGSVISESRPVEFIFYDKGRSIVVVITAIALFLIMLIFVLSKKRLNEAPDDPRKSLRKFQLIFWTLIIALSYVALWVMLGDAPLLPTNVIGLLFLTVSTTVVSSYLGLPPEAKLTNADAANRKGLNGLLMDSDDEFAITKMQSLIFTLIFGTIFLYAAFAELRIYDITTQQLILMGVSNGGYLAYKGYKLSVAKKY